MLNNYKVRKLDLINEEKLKFNFYLKGALFF